MLHRCLQELCDVICQFSMDRIVEPSKLGDSAHELDQTNHHKRLQLGAIVGQIREDIVANVDALRYSKGIPMCRDEFGQ